MSKEFILVRNEDGSGFMLLRVSAIQAVKDHTAKEKSRDIGEGKSRIWMRFDNEDDGVDSDSGAAEVLALIEGEQEKPSYYAVSDEEQKRAIEEYFKNRPG